MIAIMVSCKIRNQILIFTNADIRKSNEISLSMDSEFFGDLKNAGADTVLKPVRKCFQKSTDTEVPNVYNMHDNGGKIHFIDIPLIEKYRIILV